MSLSMRQIAVGALALVYGLFFVWFGGNGRPVTAAEGARYLANTIAADDGKAFNMVNMEAKALGS